jgi:hypothetical protein
VLAQNGRTVLERLTSLRFATADGIPTAVGVIVLGIDPPQWIPGAYVQFLRIDGDELSDPIQDEKRLDGALIDVLRQLDELLKLNITSAVDIVSEDRERRHSDYPLAALPMAQDARKPVFALTAADGAFGGHQQAAQRAFADFRVLTQRVLEAVGVKVD